MSVDYRHARDIPDVVFLRAIETVRRSRGNALWASRWDVADVLGGQPVGEVGDVPGVPHKVVLAKFRRVRGRGLVDGCDCGCRGDFELTAKGRALLAQETDA